jgi:hypothetical protein
LVALPTRLKGREVKSKSDVLGTIFGFLAAIAVAKGFETYYTLHIRPIQATSWNTLVELASRNPIPTFHLMDFFIIAIPLTHSGFLFLSSLLTYYNKQRGAPGIVVILVVCIIEAAFLYFLGSSIVKVQDNTQVEVEDAKSLYQSNAFLFWLTLVVSMATAGSIIFKLVIPYNKIPWEWILLYAFTIGFLISISSAIFQEDAFTGVPEDQKIEALKQFNIVLLLVLMARSILDYYVGQGIYFPELFRRDE